MRESAQSHTHSCPLPTELQLGDTFEIFGANFSIFIFSEFSNLWYFVEILFIRWVYLYTISFGNLRIRPMRKESWRMLHCGVTYIFIFGGFSIISLFFFKKRIAVIFESLYISISICSCVWFLMALLPHVIV